jgi:dephospho-CoA kinase
MSLTIVVSQIANDQPPAVHLAVDNFVWIANAVIAAFFIAGIVAAALMVRITQRRADEWKGLAEARGEQVDDFRNQIQELREEVGEMRGAIKALEAVKATQIAEKVVRILDERNGADDA